MIRTIHWTQSESAQTLGSLVITMATFVVSYAVVRMVNATGTLRVARPER